MAQKKSGGTTTAKKLDMVNDIRPWKEAFFAFMDGKTPVCCPICQKSELDVTAACGSDRIGFLLLSCPTCGKSANFSRVKFPASVNVEKF